MVSRRSAVSVWLACAFAMPPSAHAYEHRVSYQELRFESVVRQSLETSCATASLATLLNTTFGERFDERKLWAAYVGALPDRERTMTLERGMSLTDIQRLAASLGYRAYVVKIPLLKLLKVGRPAIIYLERGGKQPFRHFAVVDGLVRDRVILRDPSLGVRRLRLEVFASQWRGHAVFVTPYAASELSPTLRLQD